MPYWAQVLIAGVITVIVAMLLIKRIRRRERVDLDAPELVLSEDGTLHDTTGKGIDGPDKSA